MSQNTQRGYHEATDLASLPENSHTVVRVKGREIGLFNINGQIYALPNICPHQIGPLCAGKVSGTLRANAETQWRYEWVHEGEVVTCPWHGLEFHVPSGQCLAYEEIKLRTYPVKVVDNKIFVQI